jgi:RimJ/RimL family protein N-acetyltransferase
MANTPTSNPVIEGSLLIGADAAIAEMVRQRIPHLRADGFGPCTAFGILHRDVLVGGVVFNNYRKFDIHFTVVMEKVAPVSRDTVRKLFGYAFDQLGVKRITSITGRKNKKARKALATLGFREVGVAHRGLDGFEDAVIYEVLKENCKWLRANEQPRKAVHA